MTQEEKDILLKDLAARVPYGVFLNIGKYSDYILQGIAHSETNKPLIVSCEGSNFECSIEIVKPYLRPMSSMTEEELREFAKLKFKNDDIWEIDEFLEMKFGFRGFINIKCRNRNSGNTWIFQVSTRTPLETYWGIDWLNANGFDYRGLIPMGLALEAPEGMYTVKED